MSWFNPTPEEAEENYYYYKDQYYYAADQRSRAAREEQEYASRRSSCKAQISDLSRNKINFEKRAEGIEKIIKMLEGNGGWFSVDVPGTISKANKSLQKTDSSYKKCIKVTGIATASLENSFLTKSVAAEPHSASALQTLKKELVRLRQSIEDCKKQIANLNSQVETLNREIRASQSAQSSYRNMMNSSAFEMNHYRGYMY